MPRRKCFISYHHADERMVRQFVDTFDHAHDVFIVRRLGEMPEDLIKSDDTDYVMKRIRRDYIADSTVTIVLAGYCTWARRYVDWEIQASLRSGAETTPNGLLGIKLPTFSRWPERFSANLATPNYAGWIDFPSSLKHLDDAIEWAFDRRSSHAKHIVNPRSRFTYDQDCP
jgi:hypothetical protein